MKPSPPPPYHIRYHRYLSKNGSAWRAIIMRGSQDIAVTCFCISMEIAQQIANGVVKSQAHWRQEASPSVIEHTKPKIIDCRNDGGRVQ